MKRKNFIRFLLSGLSGVYFFDKIFAVNSSNKKNNTVKPPHVIVILMDDVSATEFGCYGNLQHQTPAIDAMAKEGVLFKTAWATPICMPTRVMLLTGKYGFRTNWYENADVSALTPKPHELHRIIGKSNTLISKYFKEAGYQTLISGKLQLDGDVQQDFSFDHSCLWQDYVGFDGEKEPHGNASRYWHPAIVQNGQPLPTTSDDFGPDIFNDFVIEKITTATQPVFAYYAMVLPHSMRGGHYADVPELDEKGEKTRNRIAGSLQSNVEYLDILIGKLFRKLKEAHQLENTVIILTSDNGSGKYAKAQVSKEIGQRVPFIVYAPPLYISKPHTSENLVSVADILPACCEIANIPLRKNEKIDGISFAAVLNNKDNSEGGRNYLFSYYKDKRMLRTKEWILDGVGNYYRCTYIANSTESVYKKVSPTKNSKKLNIVKKYFSKLLDDLPAPTPEFMEARQKTSATPTKQ